jgi:hypothetical protein
MNTTLTSEADLAAVDVEDGVVGSAVDAHVQLDVHVDLRRHVTRAWQQDAERCKGQMDNENVAMLAHNFL